MLSVNDLATLPALPNSTSKIAALPNGLYAIEQGFDDTFAIDDRVQTKVWFRTPTLNAEVINRIHSLQLVTSSHDQGDVDDASAGNWTWFEIAIFRNANDKVPKVQNGVSLKWTSHYNRMGTKVFDWSEGSILDKSHELFGLLEDGDVIGVVLCARFKGWSIVADRGFLIMKFGETLDRPAFELATLAANTVKIQNIIQAANFNTAYIPDAPKSITIGDGYRDINARPLRVLSLDGGGVRGLSSLYILKEVMKSVSPTKKPCEVFDMIAGTSAGGLIAIMLGCLKLSVDECIIEYEAISRKIFTRDRFEHKKSHLWNEGEFYDSEELGRTIQGFIEKRIGDRNAKLVNDEKDGCKVFVVAVREDAVNNRAPVLLRSYTNPLKPSDLPSILMWQAGRATSAAPAYFKPIQVGEYSLVDGGLGANNPIGWLWNEVVDVFGSARSTACFLSIGTGIPKNHALGKPREFWSADFTKGLASSAANSELMNTLFKTVIDEFAPAPAKKKYWRLNVGVPIEEHEETTSPHWYYLWQDGQLVKVLDNYENVGEMDDVSMIAAVKRMTEQYIIAQKDLIQGAADALKPKGS